MMPDAGQETIVDEKQPDRPKHWFSRLSALLFIVFCFELGLFLLIYPWTDSWTANYFASVVPDRMQPVWHEIWTNAYVRGGVSGLGVVNLWVALAELFEMFSRRGRE
jgi:hypothetical protein